MATVLGILLMGCSESPKDENGHFVAQMDGDVLAVRLHSGAGNIDFRYIVIDKHEYLLMTGIHISGLTHSPNCPCQKNKLILDVTPPETTIPPPNIIELVNINTNNCIMPPTNLVWGGVEEYNHVEETLQ